MIKECFYITEENIVVLCKLEHLHMPTTQLLDDKYLDLPDDSHLWLLPASTVKRSWVLKKRQHSSFSIYFSTTLGQRVSYWSGWVTHQFYMAGAIIKFTKHSH